MYEEFYGLQASPFTLSPSIKCFYHSRSHRRAFITLYFALLEGEGILVLTGPPGIGKTTVIKALQDDLEKLGEYKFVHLAYAPSAEELTSAVAQEITGQTKFQSQSHAVRLLKGFLAKERGKKKYVLAVDEAQNLDIEGLEQLRVLSNLEADEEKLLHIVLAGQPLLEEKLSYMALSQLNERIGKYAKIGPLYLEELHEYLESRMKSAGFSGDVGTVFPEDVQRRIYDYSKGIPALINRISHEALKYGFAAGNRSLNTAMVEEAARSLKITQSSEQDVKALVDHEPESGASQYSELTEMSQRLQKVELDVQRLTKLLTDAAPTLTSPSPHTEEEEGHNDEAIAEAGIPPPTHPPHNSQHPPKETKGFRHGLITLITATLIIFLSLLILSEKYGFERVVSVVTPESILRKEPIESRKRNAPLPNKQTNSTEGEHPAERVPETL